MGNVVNGACLPAMMLAFRQQAFLIGNLVNLALFLLTQHDANLGIVVVLWSSTPCMW